MKTYYTAKRVDHYNRTWRNFLYKTLPATLSAIDYASLEKKANSHTYPLRILDAACGTGLLLEQLSQRFPQAELYGVDENQDMLDQAAWLHKGHACIHFVRAALGGGENANLPFAPGSFDLITCTNSLHYFRDPSATLTGFMHLLAPDGQVVLDDYTLRGFPFPWKAFERLIKFYDPQHIRLYTLAEAQRMCSSVGLQVALAKTFQIDLFCSGWVLRATTG